MAKQYKFINWIEISGFLSFNEPVNVDMMNLNVIIGPNNSGKSNFIEALSLIRATSTNLPKHVRSRGGIDTLLNKNIVENETAESTQQVKLIINFNTNADSQRVRYELSFKKPEAIRGEYELTEYVWLEDYKTDLFTVANSTPIVEHCGSNLSVRGTYIDQLQSLKYYTKEEMERMRWDYTSIYDPRYEQSALELLQHPKHNALHYYISSQFERFWINEKYQNFPIKSLVESQSIDGQREYLLDDYSNLVKMMNVMEENPQIMELFDKYQKILNPEYEKFVISMGTRSISLQIKESNLRRPIPANRMSDGLLRFIALCVLLLQESPPTLIVIEEPEVGLHPDMLQILADLLVNASKKSQIIVTTHSDLLVSAIGMHDAEAIIICERDKEGSSMRRLKKDQLDDWLNDYSLGALWLQGHLGGTRF